MTRVLTEDTDIRWFPVIVNRMARPRANKIPWTLAEIVYEGYSQRYGSDQSLERIAERGGFGILEIADHLGDIINAARRSLAASRALVEAKDKGLDEIADNSGMTILGGANAESPTQAHQDGAAKAFGQSAEIARAALARTEADFMEAE